MQPLAQYATEILFLLVRARLARQNMKLNEVIAASAAFIMAVKHTLAGRQLFKNLKEIAGRDGKFLLQTLLQDG